MSTVARIWAICAKDATQELRRRVAIVAVFFFAATALTLVSFAIGPFRLPADDRPALQAALLWIILFFAAATGLPRAFVAEEEAGTGLALRKTVAGRAGARRQEPLQLRALPRDRGRHHPRASSSCSTGRSATRPAIAATMLLGGYGLAVVSTFLSALVARAGQHNTLFVLIAFPLVLPLLLMAIAATIEATAGGFPVMPLKVLIAYDGASTGAAYMLATVAWED